MQARSDVVEQLAETKLPAAQTDEHIVQFGAAKPVAEKVGATHGAAGAHVDEVAFHK